jgi:hypothetical protein
MNSQSPKSNRDLKESERDASGQGGDQRAPNDSECA